MRLEGRIGLVTAAGSGMGEAGARRFAREGACVAVADRDPESVERVVADIVAEGGRAVALPADLRDLSARSASCAARASPTSST